MATAEAARQLGRSKGGQAVQAAGKAHRFTSETARAAAVKSWARKGRKTKSGRRIGRPSKYQPQLDREAIRVKHASPARVWCREGVWVHIDRVISERQALSLLGYIKSPHGYIPEKVKLVRGYIPPGTSLAELVDQDSSGLTKE